MRHVAPSRVLFVCAGNTCRSPLAAALANASLPGAVAESAGTHPGFTVAGHTVTLARELAQVDLSSHQPRGVDAVSLDSFDLVVALDALVADDISELLSRDSRLVTWHVSDPYGGDLDVYRRCAVEINALISDLDT